MKRLLFISAIISMSIASCRPIYHNAMPVDHFPKLAVELVSTKVKKDKSALFTVCLGSTENDVGFHFNSFNIQPLYKSKNYKDLTPWQGGCALQLTLDESLDHTKTIKMPCNNQLLAENIDKEEVIGLIVHAKLLEHEMANLSDTLIFTKKFKPERRTYIIHINRQTIFPVKEPKYIFSRYRKHYYID